MFQNYCRWLFDILHEFDLRVQAASNYVNGFLGERLFGVYFTWLQAQNDVSCGEYPRDHFSCYDDENHRMQRNAWFNLLFPPGSLRRIQIRRIFLKFRGAFHVWLRCIACYQERIQLYTIFESCRNVPCDLAAHVCQLKFRMVPYPDCPVDFYQATTYYSKFWSFGRLHFLFDKRFSDGTKYSMGFALFFQAIAASILNRSSVHVNFLSL